MEQLIQILAKYPKAKISILELAAHCPELPYEVFAQAILQLEQQKIVTAIKAGGVNGKQPPLANAYKINKMSVRKSVQQEVKQLKKVMHPAIWIEYYLTKTVAELERDLPALQQLNHYLQQKGMPTTKVLAQERSFDIFNNEKWITDHGGKQFLEKIKVWDLLEIWPIADPVSFALNPARLNEGAPKILIVENKATFYSLLPALKESVFAALVYGQGNAINGTIHVLPEQLPLNYANVKFYYFGDIDAEGISIWYSLQRKHHVPPAIPFYNACLQKTAASGKGYQQKNEEAIAAFSQYFTQQESKLIRGALQKDCYYPQEILCASELQQIWRETNWT